MYQDYNIDFTPPPVLTEFMLSDNRIRAVRGPVGCVAPDTLILTEQGPRRICDIDRPTRVVSLDQKSGRFVLTPASAAFPKGRDVLFRVQGPHGEWLAAGHHRVLCADGEYRQVRSLVGQSVELMLCARAPHQKYASPAQSGSLGGGQRLWRTIADYWGRCEWLSRLYDLPLPLVQVLGEAAGPLLAGAPLSERDESEAARTHQGQPYGHHAKHGYQHREDDPEKYLHSLAHALYSGSCTEESLQFRGGDTLAAPALGYDLSSPAKQDYQNQIEACVNSVTNRTTVRVTQAYEEDYWDLQVPGTNNYVTVDGTVHHNSGKSSAMVMELFRRGMHQAPGKDGIRRTRAAIIRNTLEQLRTTCLPTILTMLGPLARWKPSTKTVYIEFDDVYMEWLMLPLDTPDNVRRLLSLELTYVWVSEFREIDPQLVNDSYSRCGRFPSQIQGGPTWYGLMMETNSFSEDSPWHAVLEEDLPSSWGYFIQPPGLPAGENLENLPATYYQDQIENNGGDDAYWVRQYVYNEIAPSLAGEAVFRSTFHYDFHVSKEGLIPIPQTPLCIGIDTGRNPAAILTQVDPRGRFLVLGESWGAGMSVEKFVATQLVPLLHSPRFHGLPLYGVCDPSSNSPTEYGEESVIQMLNRLGIPTVPAMTNKLDPRLRSVDAWLMRQFSGKAAMLFDKEHCPSLLLAMQSRYRFKKKKVSGELDTSPEKTNPWSDLADALQYACLGGSENIRAAVLKMLMPRREDHVYQEPASGAWT